jgi:hypothetical protein
MGYVIATRPKSKEVKKNITCVLSFVFYYCNKLNGTSASMSSEIYHILQRASVRPQCML